MPFVTSAVANDGRYVGLAKCKNREQRQSGCLTPTLAEAASATLPTRNGLNMLLTAMLINWQAFDWPSFATMFTGVIAVAAAVTVGIKQASISRRQADISEKQAAILSRQVKLQEEQLRADLFERRMATFEATADFLIHLGTLLEGDEVHSKRIAYFGEKMRESQFLFSSAVYEGLLEIWEKGNALRIDRSISISQHADGMKLEAERSVRINANIMCSLHRLENLTEIFGDEISIRFDA